MAYDPTAAAGAAPSWTVPEKFLSWDVDHTRFEMKRVLGKGESLRRAETARLARQARQAKPTAQGGEAARRTGARPPGTDARLVVAAAPRGRRGRTDHRC